MKPWEGGQSVAYLSPKGAQSLSSGRKARATRPLLVVPALAAAVSFSLTKTGRCAGQPRNRQFLRGHKF
uniref:Uncharacterized protein n=1 Tax=Arundo donax TaxID=35708 RepID=A0A0A9DYM4_ARUDO